MSTAAPVASLLCFLCVAKIENRLSPCLWLFRFIGLDCTALDPRLAKRKHERKQARLN